MMILTRTELKPPQPPSGEVAQATLSPDATDLAYAVVGGSEPGIYIARIGALEGRRLVAADGWTPIDIAWSPTKGHLAYQTARTDTRSPQVAWAAVDGDGESGRIEAMAFSWLPSGKGLIVSDAEESQLLRVDVTTGATRPLSNVFFDAGPTHWPRVCASPNGKYVAFTGRSEHEDTSRVWYLTREGPTGGEKQGEDVKGKQLTWIHGAGAQVMPFWSPKGKTMGLHVVHEEMQRTATVLVRRMEGDGEVVYQSEAVDPAVTPAWAPNTRRLALYRRGVEGRAVLTLIDVGDKEHTLLDDAPLGKLRFVDETTLVVDGGRAATMMTLSGAAS